MTIYLEDMGEVTFPFEPEEQIEKLAAFVTDFVKCPYEPEISVTLVTKEEIHEFGLQILSRYLEANAYEIEMMHPNMQMFPHIIAKKNGQLVFIIAATDVYPNKGSFADSEKAALLENAAKFDAQAACAYLGIANAEGAQNKNKELCGKAYKNANFLTDFGGLEFIYFKD